MAKALIIASIIFIAAIAQIAAIYIVYKRIRKKQQDAENDHSDNE